MRVWSSGQKNTEWGYFKTIFFKIGVAGGGVQLGPLGTAATDRPLVPAPVNYDKREIGEMNGRGNWSSRRKPAPVPLCPPQPPHAARTQTRVAVVGSQGLTAWATAWSASEQIAQINISARKRPSNNGKEKILIEILHNSYSPLNIIKWSNLEGWHMLDIQNTCRHDKWINCLQNLNGRDHLRELEVDGSRRVKRSLNRWT
jgi:hypothetical protein